MNRTLLALVLLCLSSLPAFAIQSATGWCEKGGQRVIISNNGQTSSGYFQRSFPSCTITVYLTGTSTPATIYSDGSMTPLSNPFSATVTGQWIFYAPDGNYDVQYSGTGVGSPFKIVNLQLLSSSGGGGGGTGTVTNTGTLTSGQLIRGNGGVNITVGDLAGDISTSGTLTTTLATVNSNVGSCGDATHVSQITLNAKGLATACTAVAITSGGTPAFSSITSGTNTAAAMLVGSGGSFGYTGTGTVSANQILNTAITGFTGIIKMTSGIPSVATSGIDYVGPATVTTYTAGAKQTLSQSATTAGFNLGALSIDPSVPVQGDLWYNGGVLKYRTASATLLVGGSASYTTVTFSSTPTFTAVSTTADSWTMTLTGNVSSSTLTGATTGEILTFNLCQDGTGSRTFVPPANVLNMGTIGSTASSCSHQTFVFDGTNAQALGVMIITGVAGSSITMPGSTSGSTVVQPQAIAAGTAKLPAQSGSIPTAYFCGATSGNAACANTDTAGTGRMIGGIATLASNSAVISGISPAFTSTSTFACAGQDTTTITNPVKIVNTSATSITITNNTGATDTVNWVCYGN
jgi:hypothetical protein